jgi:hypothetical protein
MVSAPRLAARALELVGKLALALVSPSLYGSTEYAEGTEDEDRTFPESGLRLCN